MPATMQAITGPDGHLSNLRPFVGSSMSAQWTPEGCYIVYSYGTPIAWHANGETFHNTHRYSNTTSKHQSACREWLAFRSTVLAELSELAS